MVRYPAGRTASYPELLELAKEAAPKGRDFVVVAESFSGPVAMEWGAQCPANLKALVLCCTFASNPLPWPLRWLRLGLGSWWFRRSLPKWVIRTLLVGQAEDSLVEDVRNSVEKVTAEVLSNRVRLALETDVRFMLERIDLPVLCLRAEQDRILGRHCDAELRRLLAQASHQTLPGPHLLLQRRPTLAAAQVNAFLDSLGS